MHLRFAVLQSDKKREEKKRKKYKERRETERSEPVLSEADDSLELRAMREWVRGMAPSKNIK